jgi:uncharacterized RDD family membrane protein YckC
MSIELFFDISFVTVEIYIISTIGLDGNFKNNRINIYIGFAALIITIVEIFVVLCNQKHRSLHDYIAGTVVIRTNELPT